MFCIMYHSGKHIFHIYTIVQDDSFVDIIFLFRKMKKVPYLKGPEVICHADLQIRMRHIITLSGEHTVKYPDPRTLHIYSALL